MRYINLLLTLTLTLTLDVYKPSPYSFKTNNVQLVAFSCLELLLYCNEYITCLQTTISAKYHVRLWKYFSRQNGGVDFMPKLHEIFRTCYLWTWRVVNRA